MRFLLSARRLLAVASVLAAVWITQSGCAGGTTDDSGLALLQADPMATAAVAGTTTGDTSQTLGSSHNGTRTQSKVLRRLPLTNEADPAAVLAAAVGQATEVGWLQRSVEVAPGGAELFDRRSADHDLVLAVSVQGTGADAVLVVSLTTG